MQIRVRTNLRIFPAAGNNPFSSGPRNGKDARGILADSRREE